MAKSKARGEFVVEHLQSIPHVATKYVWSFVVVQETIKAHLNLFTNGYIRANYTVTWHGNVAVVEVEDSNTGVWWFCNLTFPYMTAASTQNSAGKSAGGPDDNYDRAMRGV